MPHLPRPSRIHLFTFYSNCQQTAMKTSARSLSTTRPLLEIRWDNEEVDDEPELRWDEWEQLGEQLREDIAQVASCEHVCGRYGAGATAMVNLDAEVLQRAAGFVDVVTPADFLSRL